MNISHMHFNYLILSDEFDTFLLMGMIYDTKTFDMLCRTMFKNSEIKIGLSKGSLANVNPWLEILNLIQGTYLVR